VGDTVWIQKAGEIIPQVLSVDLSARPHGTKRWPVPTICPSCGKPVERVPGEVALRCRNPDCGGRLKAALFHFTRRSAMDIDHLGRVLIEQLVDAGLVSDLADLFALPAKRDALLNLPRLAEKSVDNVLASIERAKTSRSLSQLLTGLGIPLVGAVAAAQIAEVYPTLEAILAPPPEQVRQHLADLHGIGPKIADSVAEFLSDPRGRSLCEKLLSLGVHTQTKEKAQASHGPLSGHSFCVTGVLSQPRKAIHDRIEAAGGEVHDRVKQGTTYLVAGEKVGASKLRSAAKFGVKVVDEAELERMLVAAP